MTAEETKLPDNLERDLSLAPAKANIATLPYALPGLLMIFLFGAIHGWSEMSLGLEGLFKPALFFPALILGVVAHELIHGATWAAFAPDGWKSIKFGFNLKAMMPYANCRAPLRARHYRLGGLMPGLMLGALPFVFGLVLNFPVVAMFGAFFTLVAGGDFWVLYTLRKESPAAIVLDHPTRVGCVVLREDAFNAARRACKSGGN
jgi:hypothetical protein